VPFSKKEYPVWKIEDKRGSGERVGGERGREPKGRCPLKNGVILANARTINILVLGGLIVIL
jgi:hypothetical protein